MTPHVLFVDDETRVLHGLRRSLFVQGAKWKMDFADSGPAAVEVLESGACDAIVTDMQMAPMNGAELLGVVRDRWPATLRFVLSGHVQPDAAVRALQVAQQLLSKPCDVKVLISAVESGLAVQKQLSVSIVRETLGRIKTLPAAPRIHAQINAALTDPLCDARKIAAILQRDPALAANVLHLANSAFFNSGGRIAADLNQAVARVGLTTVADLVLATEVFSSSGDVKKSEALRDRALHASKIAGAIAKGRPDACVATTAALLADIGFLLPGVGSIDVSSYEQPLSEHAHAELGAALMELWSLPMPIVEAVANHHSPAHVPRDEFGVHGIVHVAVALANGYEPDKDFLEQRGVLASLAEWKEAAQRLDAPHV